IRAPLADPERYQTVYARHPGSVAAPTAGLHLTSALLERCRAVGAEVASVELAVGLDTFIGAGWRDLYARALDDGYRFLSLGDAMLVGRRPAERMGRRPG